MIYTVTLNPSLDYHMKVKQFEIGKTNRTEQEYILPGGKGINVSTVLKALGTGSVALGFLAGFSGREIERLVKLLQIQSDFVFLSEGMSRINVKLQSTDENGCTESEVNACGPSVKEEELALLFQKVDALSADDILVLSGSLYAGADPALYQKLIQKAQKKGARVVLDASGESFQKGIEAKPFFIKPNLAELEAYFGEKIKPEKATDYAKKLVQKGAEHVIVSLGGDGAVYAGRNGEVMRGYVPDGEVIQTVGCGDSMVAGFLSVISENGSVKEAFQTALAAGTVSAFSQHLANGEEIQKMKDQIKIEKQGENQTSENEIDYDQIIQMLDASVQSGTSRIKVNVDENMDAGEVKREYHHGRCDVNSPWAKGCSFDVLE